jgi:hypothetical protein
MRQLSKTVSLSEVGRSLAVVSAIVALWACSNAQVRGTRSAVTQALPITVCDLFKSPLAYRGKIVSITGVYWGGLRQSCVEPFVTAGHAWPSAINLTDSQAAAQRGNPVPFETDYRSWDELDKTVIREAKAGLRGAIWVKMTGQLRTLLGDDRSVVGGYGHLGVFPAELVVERVSDIEIKSDPPYDYREILRGPWEGGAR